MVALPRVLWVGLQCVIVVFSDLTPNYTLETVNSYCYLGVILKTTRSLTHTSMLLIEKAKPLFKIRHTIGLDL